MPRKTKPQNPVSIWRFATVKARTGQPRSSLYASIKAGTFPRPVRLGARSVGWVDAEVQKWIDDQVMASRRSAAVRTQSTQVT